MLTAKTRRHVVSNWNSISPEQLKIYHRRLRVQAIQALMDLALIAEKEKEDQLKQIFTPTTISPLLEALIGRGCEEITARHYDIAKEMLFVGFEKLRPHIHRGSRVLPDGIMTSIQKDMRILENVKPAKERMVYALENLKGTRVRTEREREAILKQHLKKQYRNQ